MIAEAPGTILQMMYLSDRIKKNKWKTFYEIGCGKGIFSKLFLKAGLSGAAIDLNSRACERSAELNQESISVNKYSILNGDFMSISNEKKYDVIFSCMVIEHIPDEPRKKFLEKCKSLLNENGRIAFLVPASKKHWGVEDEIAGHILRYEKRDVFELAENLGMKVDHISGLTFPISNWLFRISNYMVAKNESQMLNKSQQEKTIYTGSREVKYKTDFPAYTAVLLNKVVLYPLHLLQKTFSNKSESMVLYFELRK